MRKYLFTIIALFISSYVWARPASQHSSYIGTKDLCVKIRNESGTVSNDQCKDFRISDNMLSDETTHFLLKSGVANGGATTMTTQDTEVSTSFTKIDKEIASDPAFQTGTLPDGESGQIITIRITLIQGTGTWTLTPDTATGFTSLLFEAVDDMVTLLYVDDTVGWILISQGSVQRVN